MKPEVVSNRNDINNDSNKNFDFNNTGYLFNILNKENTLVNNFNINEINLPSNLYSELSRESSKTPVLSINSSLASNKNDLKKDINKIYYYPNAIKK